MVRSEPRYNFVRPSDVFEQVVFSLTGDAMRLPRTVFRWAVSFPALSLPILGCGAVAHQWGASTATAAGVLTVLLFIAWRLVWPRSFRRWVSGRIRVRWRGWSHYQRPWPEISALHGLANTLDHDVLVPQLKRIVIGTGIDVLDRPDAPWPIDDRLAEAGRSPGTRSRCTGGARALAAARVGRARGPVRRPARLRCAAPRAAR